MGHSAILKKALFTVHKNIPKRRAEGFWFHFRGVCDGRWKGAVFPRHLLRGAHAQLGNKRIVF